MLLNGITPRLFQNAETNGRAYNPGGQIADNLNITLLPKGVAVVIEARHMCRTMRGVQKKTVKMVTNCMTGVFRDDAKMKSEFMSMIGSPRSG